MTADNISQLNRIRRAEAGLNSNRDGNHAAYVDYVRGYDVQGEHRGKGPKGYRRSDERIGEDVSDRLTDNPHLDASDLSVSVANGEVTLSGTISDRAAKRDAEDCAYDGSGVMHVQNNLRIRSDDDPTGA
jgi:osmotically-inducible protein OsmY